MKLIQAQDGATGIVYAHQRKTCDWLASKLGNAGVDATAYHAGKDGAERNRAQAQWMEGAFDCIVATVAFGMVSISVYLSHVARECCACENALCHAAQCTWRMLLRGVHDKQLCLPLFGV